MTANYPDSILTLGQCWHKVLTLAKRWHWEYNVSPTLAHVSRAGHMFAKYTKDLIILGPLLAQHLFFNFQCAIFVVKDVGH